MMGLRFAGALYPLSAINKPFRPMFPRRSCILPFLLLELLLVVRPPPNASPRASPWPWWTACDDVLTPEAERLGAPLGCFCPTASSTRIRNQREERGKVGGRCADLQRRGEGRHIPRMLMISTRRRLR